MKIPLYKNENFKLCNKTKPSLKTRSRKRVKNKEITISKQGSSLDNTKISYIKSPCGTIECIEKMPVINEMQNVSKKKNTSSPSMTKDLESLEVFDKPLKHKVRKRKLRDNHRLVNLSPNNLIVKMTHDSSVNSTNTILQNLSFDLKKSESSFSVLDSLMSTGNRENEMSLKGPQSEKINEQTESSVPRKNMCDKFKQLTIKTGKSSSNIGKTAHNFKRDQGFPNGPVCSALMNNNMSNSVADFYELGCSKYLVFMKPESNITVVGITEVQILKGSLEILGYNSHKNNEKLLIFSPLGSSHLSIKAKDGSNLCQKESCSNIHATLTTLGLSGELSDQISQKAENGALFTITKNKTDVSSTVWPQFFEHHSSFNVFPNVNLFLNDSRPCHNVERKIQCLLEANSQEVGLKEFTEVPEWNKIEQEILLEDYPKVILSGGKSVGKSSLLRYLVNKCLFKWEKILVLDFDLGQCEFTPPGCVSATLVEGPLLGPNYSHLKEPERSVFLGEVDVTKCPGNYVEGCKTLIDHAKNTHGDIPWLVNTMGFTRGFGVSLACGIINYLMPTHVVQIQSKDRKLNFPSVLEPKYVVCMKHSAFDVANSSLDYKLYPISSGSEQSGFVSKSRGMSPAESRNLVVLSYFSGMLNANIASLSQVTPYMIGLDQLDLQTTNHYDLTKDQIAATMSGNMVALCHKISSSQFPNCRGFGIVRAVDWQSRTMFVITPLTSVELGKVNCLMKGNIGLPDSLYYNQGDQVIGHIPYLALTSGGSTARFAKRDFRNLPLSRDNRQQ